MTAYYNEFDPKAAAWLRELIAQGHVAPGEVDERSITDVRPDELLGFTQCHFFAGIGGWSLALRLAGWPDDRPVWTGSCPCQPFSAAGKQKGKSDDRHLWPHWFRLIRECAPDAIHGEQVAGAIKHGWLDDVQADLEKENYACGPVVLPACGFGAPHMRQRLWFVAKRLGDSASRGRGVSGDEAQPGRSGYLDGSGDTLSELGNSSRQGLQERVSDGRIQSEAMEPQQGEAAICGSDAGKLADTDGRDASAERKQCSREQRQQPQDGSAGKLAHSAVQRHDGGRASEAGDELSEVERSERFCDADRMGESESIRPEVRERGHSKLHRYGFDETSGDLRPGPTNGQWRNADWLGCTDGKWRPVEPGTFPLAHGLPARVGRLRGYGNAIVPQAAAEVIGAFMDFERIEI